MQEHVTLWRQECSSPYRKMSLISVHICSPFKSQTIKKKTIIKTYINEKKTSNICSVLVPCQRSFRGRETAPCTWCLFQYRLVDEPCSPSLKKFSRSLSFIPTMILVSWLLFFKQKTKYNVHFQRLQQKHENKQTNYRQKTTTTTLRTFI